MTIHQPLKQITGDDNLLKSKNTQEDKAKRLLDFTLII
jgi:hypothetical protein